MALFSSFFIGGFECASHRDRNGRRLDLLAATAHDRHAGRDYARLRECGITVARDGVRWHLMERSPGRYSTAGFARMVKAAVRAKIQVIWDLCHYGWPHDVDVFAPCFVTRFARMAEEVARVLVHEADAAPFLVPINEISYLSWAAGEAAVVFPAARGRGWELKRQLVRASIAAIDAIRRIVPSARFVSTEPLISVTAACSRLAETDAANRCHEAQYQACDMLSGRLAPDLGGAEEYLDIVGANYYPANQWTHADGPLHPCAPIDASHLNYRLPSQLLAQLYKRYKRPLLIAETGVEGKSRPAWLRHIAGEVEAALGSGIPIEGICWYPVLDYPGFEDGRHCRCGLWGYADRHGARRVYAPLRKALFRQQSRLESVRSQLSPLPEHFPGRPAAWVRSER